MKLSPTVGVCAILIALGWQPNALAADTLLIHGHIYTGILAHPGPRRSR